MPRMFVIAGCNGAGKTTASYTVLPGIFECRNYVNSDEIASMLSPGRTGGASAIRASRLMLERMDELMERGEDFAVETTLATRTLLTTIANAQKNGYVVTLVFYWLRNPEAAVERVRKRVESGGHNIPEATILRRYWLGIKHLRELYMPMCDYWYIVDNNGPTGIMVAQGGRDLVTTVHNYAVYEVIMSDL
ncbi:MAG: zeta toxin family protein [Bacteroidales bacterium]|nr:zeta toxin family protein [Bacteroidales bacterium]